MLDILKNNPRYLVGAIIVHLFFLVLFGVGFHFTSEKRAATAVPQTVKVNTVDEQLVKKELEKLKAADDREVRRKQELEKKRKQEEQRLKAVREQRLAEQKKEKQRLALVKQQQEQEKKKLKELEKQRREQEQLEREQELKNKMKAEMDRLQKEQELAALRQKELKAKQTLISKYQNLIEAKVYQNWIRPPGDLKGRICELHVRLIPTGDVISIELSKSSGDSVYDKSVMAAVKKASPLPLPPAEAGLFETFRDLRIPILADKKT